MEISQRFGRTFIMVLLSLLGGLAACGGGDVAPENVYIADEADNGQSVTMAVGDMLQIILQENQSTGYLWSVVTNDEDVLQTSEEPAYEVESDADGAGGQKTFLFEAIAPGTSVLRLVSAMEQDTAVEPDRTFELTIVVSQ